VEQNVLTILPVNLLTGKPACRLDAHPRQLAGHFSNNLLHRDFAVVTSQ
jgi:hypothetical protein